MCLLRRERRTLCGSKDDGDETTGGGIDTSLDGVVGLEESVLDESTDAAVDSIHHLDPGAHLCYCVA